VNASPYLYEQAGIPLPRLPSLPYVHVFGHGNALEGKHAFKECLTKHHCKESTAKGDSARDSMRIAAFVS